MRFAITGASGLVGGNLAVELCARGHQVVATKRGQSRVKHLAALPIRWVEADLSDESALARAFEGCDGVFHCAAAVSIKLELEPWIVAANVGGTRSVIAAVRRAGVKRLVHCSTVGAVGLSVDGAPCDEGARWNMEDFGLADAYVTTKRQAEELVAHAVSSGLDAVVVNPGFMIGPYDAKPSSGKLVRDLLLGRAPGYTKGKNSFVDVRDVVRGMISAFQRGRRGERYILAGRNLTYKEFMDVVSQAAGAPRVRLPVPAWALAALGRVGDAANALGIEAFPLTSATARWAANDRFVFSSAKAQRELGYTISPLEPAVRDCAAWFRANGMLG